MITAPIAQLMKLATFFFPQCYKTQEFELLRYLSTGKRVSGSSLPKSLASRSVKNGIKNALAVLPLVLVRFPETRSTFNDDVIRELATYRFWTIDTIYRFMDICTKSPEKISKLNSIEIKNTLDFLAFHICSLQKNNQYYLTAPVFCLCSMLSKLCFYHFSDPVEKKENRFIWKDLISNILKESPTHYNKSNCYSLLGYFGDDSKLEEFLSEKDSLEHEMSVMALGSFPNFFHQKDWDKITSGGHLDFSSIQTSLLSILNYAVQMLKLEQDGNEVFFEYRVSWINAIFKGNGYNIPTRLIPDIRRTVELSYHQLETESKNSRKLFDETWKRINRVSLVV